MAIDYFEDFAKLFGLEGVHGLEDGIVELHRFKPIKEFGFNDGIINDDLW